VEIEVDSEPLPTDRVPGDLSRAFAALSPSHKCEYVGFVIEAKKPETRGRRIETTIATLAASAATSRRRSG
jgi:uncharacterized protein YdeI (YjbR/CyaY-like superfamily)